MSVDPDVTAPVAPSPAGSACQWPVSYVSCNPDGELPPALAGLSDEQRAQFEQMAADYLHAWTGLGVCPVTIRPCRTDCTEGQSTFTGFTPAFAPHLIEGKWYNVACGVCGDDCGCSSTPAFRLPGPVDSIAQIAVDGRTLDPAAYRVDNYSLLVRQDGAAWPTCQDMSAPADSPGTWQITYLRGTEVPAGGQAAAGILAEQFAKAFCNDSSCQLPRRVQSITRQGVTVAVLDSFDGIEKGHTGIWVVDSWIASTTKPRGASRVFSPDRPNPRHRVQTWPR